MSDEDFIYMRERKLPYPVFDSDNHFYETRDSFTKFLPKEYEGYVKYVEVNNRTKLAIKDKISDYIPNPTFTRVAPPGAWRNPDEHRRSIPSTDAFFDPEPRLALMKDMGIDRTLMWPTLASVLEERLADDSDAVHAIVHALNQWILDHWTFNYSDAIFATPIIALNIVEKAIEELEYLVDNGARIFLMRVATVPGLRGRRSFALPEFDPFWEKVQEADIVVGMHSGDPGYQKYVNEWEGYDDAEFLPFARPGSPTFSALASDKSPIVDATASIIGHGLATRFPDLKFLPVEYGYEWVRPFVEKMQRTYEKSAALFDEDPMDTFKRCMFVHPFHEPDPAGLAELIGVDNILFGSDFPHPEGLNDPLAYAEVVEKMPVEDQAKIMGGNLARLMKVDS
jgi:predicted TIM-barrel fold metal-dependent hydrolase